MVTKSHFYCSYTVQNLITIYLFIDYNSPIKKLINQKVLSNNTCQYCRKFQGLGHGERENTSDKDQKEKESTNNINI